MAFIFSERRWGGDGKGTRGGGKEMGGMDKPKRLFVYFGTRGKGVGWNEEGPGLEQLEKAGLNSQNPQGQKNRICQKKPEKKPNEGNVKKTRGEHAACGASSPLVNQKGLSKRGKSRGKGGIEKVGAR